MNRSGNRPRETAELGVFFPGAAATLFSIIAGVILLPGNPNFEIDLFGVSMNPLSGLLAAAVIVFCVTCLLSDAICFMLQRVITRPGKPSGGS